MQEFEKTLRDVLAEDSVEEKAHVTQAKNCVKVLREKVRDSGGNPLLERTLSRTMRRLGRK